MKIIRVVLVILPLLASCQLNHDLDCPMTTKGSCQRLDEIYNQVNGLAVEETDETAQRLAAPLKNMEVLHDAEANSALWLAPMTNNVPR